jgi:hypothetical protein
VKYATFSKSAFAVTAILVATACAESVDLPDEGAPAGDQPPPAATIPPASKPPPTPEKKCAPSCKTDGDCATSCPTVPGGVQCCDVKSGACFGSKTSTCPAATPDPVDPPPAY